MAKKKSSKKAAIKPAGAKKASLKKKTEKKAPPKNKRLPSKALRTSSGAQRKPAAASLGDGEDLKKIFSARQEGNPGPLKLAELEKRISELQLHLSVSSKALLQTVNRINPNARLPIEKMPEDVKKSIQTIRPDIKRFHGAKLSLLWFPFPWIFSPCADKFGYMSSTAVRNASKLPFTLANQVLLGKLGDLMGDLGREAAIPDSTIPSGYTYFGQFVDHDITLDVSSTLDTATDANTINNMRTPVLDLDSLYGRGPALDPYLYVFPTVGPATAIKFQMGSNTPTSPGGPGGNGGFGGMKIQSDFDVPRMTNPLNPVNSSHTAIIGDPRNDENLIVVQFHQTMLRFHNQVVDLLVLIGFSGDIFVEAKKIVTHHYQWAAVNDFLKRICGPQAVTQALGNVIAPIDSPFRMPVEFSVAAYRFGHSMIRDQYWVNFNFPSATLSQVFQFNRNPNLPVLSNWVVDFNAFFNTGVPVPVNNKARPIDSVLANGLESIPGGSGIMAILATRNLRRGLAFGLPSGQAMAQSLNVPVMSAAQLTTGLPANEIAILNSAGGLLLSNTPLWYYILREGKVIGGGNQLGPLGAKIVADTFIRMLKRDGNSYLNVLGGFTPMLPSVTVNDFTVADLVIFAGVTQP
ncbi:MAG: peroxidase family protein [Flavisolibacter sp.]